MKPLISEVMLAIGGSFTASILFKVTLTTALTLAITRLASRTRASVRHVLLAAAFALLLLLPIVSALVPPVHIAVPAVPQAVFIPSSAEALTDMAPAVMITSAGASVPPKASASFSISLSTALFATWLCGMLLFLFPVFAGLWQTRSLRRSGLPWRDGQCVVDQLALDAGIRRRVDVLLHESVPGPMTCGVVCPAVMLPVDAPSWPAGELSRAIVHELEHVRRGDWLSRCLARTLCGVYWFHPLVWAAWRQFVLEAERACDDAVLRRAEATVYADQLVVLAQRLLSKPEQPMLAMANRYDLAKRVAALLDSRQRRGRAGALGIGLACFASALLVTAISPLHIVARSQTPAKPAPAASAAKFDVASIKPCREEDFAIPGQRRPETTISPGRAEINCLTAERIIYLAYAGIGSLDHPLLNDSPANPDHIRGGPGWIRTEHFVIEGKAEGTPDRSVMMGPMLRALLEERFHLKTHRETEEVPLYALTVAKGGLKIHPLEDGGCTSHEAVADASREERMAIMRSDRPVCGSFTSLGDGVNGNWTLGGDTLARFANSTLSNILDRYVMDKTGVAGMFNIHLEFGFDDNIAPGVFGGRPSLAYTADNPPPPGIEKGPSIFTALEDQLGLKLEKIRGPREYLVIDSLDRPSGL